MYACLAVTCHLHFWQNDRGLLRATAVTRGWNGYRSDPEASQCATIIGPAFGQRFRTDPDRMRIGSVMFTGL